MLDVRYLGPPIGAVDPKQTAKLLTNKLTGARGRRPAGTHSPHEHGEAMGAMGVRVELTVRLVSVGEGVEPE